MKKFVALAAFSTAIAAVSAADVVYDWGSWTTDPAQVVESDDNSVKVVLFTNPTGNLAIGTKNDQGGMGEMFDGDPATYVAYGQSNYFIPVFTTPIHVREIRIYVKDDSNIWQFGMAARSGITGLDMRQIPGIRAGVGGDPNAAYAGWNPPYGPHLGSTATGNRYLSISMSDGSYLQPCLGNIFFDTGLQWGEVHAVEYQFIGDPAFATVGSATVGSEDASEIVHAESDGVESWTFSSTGRLAMEVSGKSLTIVTLDANDDAVSSESLGIDTGVAHIVSPGENQKIRIEARDMMQPLGSASVGTYDGSEVVYSKAGETETWVFSSKGKFVPGDVVYLSVDGGEARIAPSGKVFVANPGENETVTFTATPFGEPAVYAAGVSAVGGNVSIVSTGARDIYTFTGASTLTFDRAGFIELLVVGGGGGGGGTMGGGGGAGGMLYFDKAYVEAGTYGIAVGGGGAGVTETAGTGGQGGNSSFGDFVAYGGGGGGSYSSIQNGANGGSGGGGCNGASVRSEGVDGQGNGGGIAYEDAPGGGGGAGTPGFDASSGGHGGDGLPCAITGEEVWYAGGGGAGAGWNGRGGYAEYGGKGGKGGGANGSNRNSAIPGYSAPDGFGGGGGGGSHSPQTAGGNGGAGTVIVSVMNCDPTDEIPDLDRIGVDETTEFTATLKYNILNLGEGETAADVTVEYGFGADSLDFTAQFPAVDTAGRHELVLEGLSEATTYYARITLAGRNSGAEGRSGLFVFTTAAGTAFPDAFGLFEVKLEGGANAESDLSLIEYGDADTQLHKAATALGKFYSADGWTAGETWAYKGYMFFKANQRLDFVSGQHGFSYIKIGDTVYLNETGNHDGVTCTWAGTNQEDLWLPVEFRVGCAVGVTPGPNSYQLKFLRDLNWNENWIYIPENLLRLYTGSAIDISSATRIGDTIHANIAVHDPRIFGETLYVRHGSDPDARESWDSAEIVDGSFEIGQGDTYYQVYATAGDVEYPSAMTAVSEARVLGAENPEVTYAGLSNVTFGGADVNFSVVSTGSAATTDVTVEYGTLPDRLEYSAAAAGLGAGPGTISLSGLVPETDYYFIVSTVNGAGAEGVDSALATFRTAADPTGAFESDEDAIQIGAGFSLDGTGGDTVAIAGTLLSDGGGARVYAIWSGDASFATASTNELSVADGAISGVISGLSVSTRYYVRLYAEGGAGYFATPARQVATSGAAVISSTWTGSSLGHVDIYFSLDDVGAGGSVAVTLYIDGVEVETKNLSAAGIAVFSHQHATLGQHVYMLATSNTTALGLELDGATAETGYALVSNGAYYWRGAKGGLWSDAANWYCPQGTGQGMADCGYPDNASATVFFQGAAAGEVEIAVDGGYTVGKLVPYELDRSITLAGAAAGASLTVKSVLDGGEGGYEDGENGRSWGSTIEFADMGVAFDCEMVPPPGGRFVFRRCAVYPNFGYMTLRYTGSSAEFREGTTANFGYGIQIHSTNTKLVVDDSTLVCRDLRFPIFPSDTGNVIEFFGSSPKLQAYDQIRANDQQPGSGYDGSAAYVFHVPAGGYLSAPVEGMLSTTRFNEYEAGINFVIAADSGLFSGAKTLGIPLVDFSLLTDATDFHTNGFAFASQKRPDAVVFSTATGKALTIDYLGGSGTVILVK